jgi:NADH-quinone oxidoreductase subunit A
MLDDYFRQYGLIAIFAVVAVIVPTSLMMVSWLASKVRIRPQKPDPVKLDVYECGMQAIGGRWGQFNFRYYTYALLFVVFDVEVIFIYPWAVKFNQLGLFALVEMAVFILILMVAWAYAWRKQDLEWR